MTPVQTFLHEISVTSSSLQTAQKCSHSVNCSLDIFVQLYVGGSVLLCSYTYVPRSMIGLLIDIATLSVFIFHFS